MLDGRRWNAIAYGRGFDKGNGWAEDCEDIPDRYREQAKDAYDNGASDYAELLEEEEAKL